MDGEPEKGREVVWLPMNYHSILEDHTKERQTDSYHYQYLYQGKLLPCGEYDYDEEGFPFDHKITLVSRGMLRNAILKATKLYNAVLFRQALSDCIANECDVRRGDVNYNDFMNRADHICHSRFDKRYMGTLRYISRLLQPHRHTMYVEDWNTLSPIKRYPKQSKTAENVEPERREESTENTGVSAE